MNDDISKCIVLIVDDNKNNLDILVEVLGGKYDIRASMDGESALKLIESEFPDLILLDIMMPNMDGYELCRLLKADNKTKNIPIIFLTAMNDVDDERKGFEMGAIDYITKPISPPIVCSRVKNQLQLKLAYEKIEKQNKQLEKQNLKLIRDMQLKDDIERIARHDIKSPLNPVIAFPDIIKNLGDLNSQQLHYLDIIKKSGYRILNIINQSIDLLKIENGMYKFEPREVDIINSIDTITQELQNLIQRKTLSIKVLINGILKKENEKFIIHGESMLCYTMFSNLIKNAIEASPKQEIIQINMWEEDNNTKIEIQNMGEVPEHIKNNFFDKYVTSKKKGTGLGTYSAKMMAEIHKGSISLSSSKEKGTSIIITLPNLIKGAEI